MKRISLIALLALGGCSSLNEGTIAGGGCDRDTTYGIEFALLGVNLDFKLAARCEETQEAE